MHHLMDQSRSMTAEHEATNEQEQRARPGGSGDGDEGQRAAGDAEAGPGGDLVDNEEAELRLLQAEMDALHDRHLRLAAEFDNYRKRIERERAELRIHSQADLVKHLLEALDDLQRFREYDPETASASALLEGVDMVEKKLRRVLENAGLEPVDAAGEFFNPSTMEALMTLPAEHAEEDEMVADVFQRGYRFGDLLIRPAKVRVKKYE